MLGQAVADHLAAQPVGSYEPVRTYFPDEDILFAAEDEPLEIGRGMDSLFRWRTTCGKGRGFWGLCSV